MEAAVVHWSCREDQLILPCILTAGVKQVTHSIILGVSADQSRSFGGEIIGGDAVQTWHLQSESHWSQARCCQRLQHTQTILQEETHHYTGTTGEPSSGRVQPDEMCPECTSRAAIRVNTCAWDDFSQRVHQLLTRNWDKASEWKLNNVSLCENEFDPLTPDSI